MLVSLSLLMVGLPAAVSNADTGCNDPVEPPLSSGVRQVSSQAHVMWLKQGGMDGALQARLGESYVLTDDVSLAGCVWTSGIAPSGFVPFTGEFDGAGFSITGFSLAVTSAADSDLWAGFFARTGTGAVVKNLNLAGSVTVTGQEKSITSGLLIGQTSGSTTTVSSVSVTGSITVASTKTIYAGGAIGLCSGSDGEPTLEGIDADVTVGAQTSTSASVTAYVGGVCGVLNSTIESASVRGSISTSGKTVYVGGIAGYSSDFAVSGPSTSVDISADGGGSGDVYAGGIVGQHNGTSTLSGASSGSVSVSNAGNAYAGGIAGWSFRPIDSATSTGSVTINSASMSVNAGGLVGNGIQAITNSSATGGITVSDSTASGGVRVGGLAGYAGASITRSFATGNVAVSSSSTGLLRVGGLAGDQFASVSEVFASGNVSVTSTANSGTDVEVGGLSGRATTGRNITNAYALGSVSVTTTQQNAYAGGLAGSGNGTFTETYAAGSVSATSSPGTARAAGTVPEFSAASASLVDSFCVSQAASACSPAAAAGSQGTLATIAELKTLSYFEDAGWSIADGYSSTTTWGMCSNFNRGFPFLNFLYSSDPCAESPADPVPAYADFIYLLPDGRECSSISPQRVQVGTMHALPGEDALCQTSDGSLVAGWVIPVPQGFTGYGSVHEPFPPGSPVRVTDSQRFTLVPYEQTLQIDYDANIATDDACTPANVLHGSQDGRVEYVWVPRVDFSMARTPSQAPCQPDGYELVGWNTSGDGTGEVIGLGEPLPEDWATHRTNHHTLYATWQAA